MPILLVANFIFWTPMLGALQAAAPLPDAPQPQIVGHPSPPKLQPCPAKSTQAVQPLTKSDNGVATSVQTVTVPCLPPPPVNWFERFLTGPQVKPLTPKEKARLALRNVLDHFNNVTILADAAIAVGSDSDSPYGPGMKGFAKNAGVSYAQDLSGEFVCTFLIPSIAHQDPHYHRMPKAKIPRRVLHTATQVVWAQGDNGKGMVNYAYIVGAAGLIELSNLYVPAQQTNLPASAQRYIIGLATAPLDNLTSEFLPDVAKHIHVQIVVIQRIIDKVGRTNDGSGQ